MTPKRKSLTILILGGLTALSPFSIDMYLPAFPEIARDFNTTVAQVSLSLASYFIGLALGQLFYGPLLDRFGRKKPLYAGLIVYILCSLGCLFAESNDLLIFLRFIQALGGCAAGVTSMAMVRDLFTMKESAKVFSLLILILGVSPLLAPTLGGYLSAAFGWHSVFIALTGIAVVLFACASFLLPESHTPDATIRLKISPIAKTFWIIFKNPQFYTHVLAGSVAFSGLFSYLAGSPVIFMEIFKISGQAYSWIFATIATGFILMSQLNVVLLKRHSAQQLLFWGLAGQALTGVVFFIGAAFSGLNIHVTVFLFFLFISFMGLINPNAGALALAPFSKNAGSASALMGFLQMGLGAAASMTVGLFVLRSTLPIIALMATTSVLGFIILIWGRKYIPDELLTEK